MPGRERGDRGRGCPPRRRRGPGPSQAGSTRFPGTRRPGPFQSAIPAVSRAELATWPSRPGPSTPAASCWLRRGTRGRRLDEAGLSEKVRLAADQDGSGCPLGCAGGRVTVRVNAWTAVPCRFVALRISGYVPGAASSGNPEMTAVPFRLSANLTPHGSRPVLVIVGAGGAGRGDAEGERQVGADGYGRAAGEDGLSFRWRWRRDGDGLGTIATEMSAPAVLVAVAIGVTD